MPKRSHPVFTVFDLDAITGNNKCRNCSSVITGSHASNLMNHLKKKHQTIYSEINEQRNSKEATEHSNSQTSIESFTEKGKLSFVTLNITFDSLVDILIEQICINGRPLISIEDSGIVKILHPIMNQLGNPILLFR